MERFEKNSRYHQVIRHEGILYLSGQTATDAGDDILSQSKATLNKIDQLLGKYGSDRTYILHADVYLQNQEDVSAFNAVWEQWIDSETAPTRACIVSKMGRDSILVEVVVTAAVKDQARSE